MKLRIGLSPCPNDTFVLHALLHGLVRTDGVTFEPVVEDVEALNGRMLRGELEVTKASYAAFAYARDRYAACRTGAALGRGAGPLVVAARNLAAHDLGDRRVLLPGENTTAALLFRAFHPEVADTVHLRYDLHLGALLRGEADAAVIIHELRFTYREHGLHAVEDLGLRWEGTTRLPLPLGGYFVRRDLEPSVAQTVERAIAASLRHARAHPEASRDFVRRHAQELSDGVTAAHIGLYVNTFSDALGPVGEKAVRRLLLLAERTASAPRGPRGLFVGDVA